VLTDLLMPEMDGLQLVAAIRSKFPLVPVVLMTAYGNEEIAIRALQRGAASYVPKRILHRDLAPILTQVLAAAQGERRQERLLGLLSQAELHFTLDNDRTLIPALVAQLQQYLLRLGLCDQPGRTRVGVALEETLLNAMYHGNLDVSSELREGGEERYHQLADERRQQPPYKNRRVYCTARFSTAEAVFVVRDEGRGFDPSKLPDPTDPVNMEKASGRGLLLVRTFMDQVTFSDQGNQITLVKLRERAAENPL
jgi:CheY-like chemotaxis protein